MVELELEAVWGQGTYTNRLLWTRLHPSLDTLFECKPSWLTASSLVKPDVFDHKCNSSVQIY